MKNDFKMKRKLSTQELRALQEAQERNKEDVEPKMPKELGGRGGPEPTRFGDWEKNGITSDF